ncbi:uncharacterized protein BDR25DRAFT_319099 [Lindgomyces ingoldianus]|uniref:Uncharacterized protein n=1 Tax=Lindgomyces ingoldianus TaxID=673940 RepID=A0ACB6QDK2_9PLEO|nr:uncharacterized protein BDR25DRAFT_319099 [Lindgomyces ingoldianus]KAF2464575.1 hypothetical protein BDR25DRAFT_319099 [Lindgomyces ingoldianus]
MPWERNVFHVVPRRTSALVDPWRAPLPDLEALLLQRWSPVFLLDKSTLKQHERFSETDLRGISDVLRRVGRGAWSRIYTVLRLLDCLDVICPLLAQATSGVYSPFTHQTLPQSLNPSVAHEFLQVQRAVLWSALVLERETGRHRHFLSADDMPFIKVEELGKGAYGYVDRVISTASHKEYAWKLIPRGRIFHRHQKILRDFERELGTLKKLCHHRHIAQLIGSYTDPQSTHPGISLDRLPTDSTAYLDSEEAVNPVVEAEKTRSDDLDEKSTADADEHVERTSDSYSLTVERTAISTTSGKEDVQYQHGHSGNSVEKD